MHDPLIVAFEIRRPWPKRDVWKTELALRDGVRWQFRGAFNVVAGRGFYWPSFITVWHREPGGHDSLTICERRTQRSDGTWHRSRAWRFHVHHWKIQVVPLQMARRRLLTRCTSCGGRSTKAHPVNVGMWDGERGPWWRGETGLRHVNCTSMREPNRV